MNTRKNALDQAIDIAGSYVQEQNRVLGDEPNGLGKYKNQGTGTLTFGAPLAGTQNITGMTGMVATDVGRYFKVASGPVDPNNIGSFVITVVTGDGDIDVTNAGGSAEAGVPNCVWEVIGSSNLTFGAPAAGIQTITGLVGMTPGSAGRFLQVVSGPSVAGDIGTFLIVTYNSATSVDVVNTGGGADGPHSSLWNEREPYTLEDDINFERTDRRLIKGTASFSSAIPTYARPTDLATSVDANLTNIATKTTDAKALCVNAAFAGQTVATGNTHKTLVSTAGALKHAGANDRTGVPIWDGADAGDWDATYVEIIDPATGVGLKVHAIGAQHDWRIFGRTRAGAGGVAALGTITTDLQNTFIDGDLFVLNDGTALGAVTYYFDVTGGYSPGGGYNANKRRLNVSADVTANDIRDTIIAAINLAGNTQAITAASGGAGLVNLTNDNVGAQGNQTSTFTVVGPSLFAITGMAGGTMGFSPYSVDVEFRSVAPGAALSTSVAYTWEATQPTLIDLYYGYRKRLDLFGDTDLRTTLVNGLIGDAGVQQEIDDILETIGTGPGNTSLAGLLTPATNYWIWSDLPDATPSVVEALNTINDQVGVRNWTGGILTPGDTITDALQDLSDAIGSATFERVIERLASNAPSGTSHLLPGAKTYHIGTADGQSMFVYWRGLLRDPGTVVAGDDYGETNQSHITPYSTINQHDHINYIIYQPGP